MRNVLFWMLLVVAAKASPRHENFLQLYDLLPRQELTVQEARQPAYPKPDPVLSDPDLAKILKGGRKAWLLPKVDHPKGEQPTELRLALGESLFVDKRLSRDFQSACVSCHNPKFGFGDGRKLSIGFGNQVLKRHTPSLWSTAWQVRFMWDGRFDTLAEQAFGPIESPEEMNLPAKMLVQRLQQDTELVEVFEEAWPGEGLQKETIGKSLAVFQRSILPGESRFDRFMKGDQEAMTETEIDGFALFLNPNKGRCVFCHHPPHFTDQKFHNIGVFPPAWKEADEGRGELDPREGHKFAFKTPGLRNVDLHPPYFHDGSARSLHEVVAFYNRGGDSPQSSPLIQPLGLTPEEVEAIVAFLGALTDEKLEGRGLR